VGEYSLFCVCLHILNYTKKKPLTLFALKKNWILQKEFNFLVPDFQKHTLKCDVKSQIAGSNDLVMYLANTMYKLAPG